MATRVAFENSNEIGVFCALTNGYCLTGRNNDLIVVLYELNADYCHCALQVLVVPKTSILYLKPSFRRTFPLSTLRLVGTASWDVQL